jgi:hypothetical protein
MSIQTPPKIAKGPSKVELIKAASESPLGTLPDAFAAPNDKVSEDGAQLLKFHAVYQQDDRAQRAERFPGEAFDDSCHRIGPEARRERAGTREAIRCS